MLVAFCSLLLVLLEFSYGRSCAQHGGPARALLQSELASPTRVRGDGTRQCSERSVHAVRIVCPRGGPLRGGGVGAVALGSGAFGRLPSRCAELGGGPQRVSRRTLGVR